jgi:hypothetical protein
MGRVARLILNYAGEKILILIYEKLVKQATIGNIKIKFHSHLNPHHIENPKKTTLTPPSTHHKPLHFPSFFYSSILPSSLSHTLPSHSRTHSSLPQTHKNTNTETLKVQTSFVLKIMRCSRFTPRFFLYFPISTTEPKPLIGANHTSSRFCSR